ncbi:OmpA-OmpF porin, OOP family [Roseovarius pacificus]|uniref:OmpA-OmpF porin, OOP family n=1 Tax=Roseovarius pacificus TaxID=337701 RepID=A0A1M7FP28_9RHOB|nr:OmpA family protein [Roseovarius pacificus]GGO59292.1 membrane protein [Roseovarius pacificus]SHM05804.1 OmpA-OmpF porin, OOP family [Roseovarius pacificus]
MRLSTILVIAATFLISAAMCLMAARFAVTAIEDSSRTAVRDTLDQNDMVWAEVDANGLQVFLAGTAPSEAVRFKALSVAGTVVDAARVIDQMLVADSENVAPPRFSIEILRNDSGISLIGLVPAATDRDALMEEITDVADGAAASDLLESADYPQPEAWEEALEYAVDSLKLLPRAKISVDAERVLITAMVDSEAAKRQLEIDLARNAPTDIRLALDISAPRPVITPFALRFLIEDGQARFDACAADTEEARDRILTAAGRAGLAEKAECVIGLGVPSPKWGQAVEMAIDALAELGNGSLTFSDADISLIAATGTSEAQFDEVVGRLETSLPEVFALHAVLPKPEDQETIKPEFTATLSPEGLVQIRGRVASELARETVDSFAKARFTSDAVHTTARVVEGLPRDWSLRVLTGVEALSYLSNGSVMVKPDEVTVNGNTGRKDANAMISSFLSDKLGEGEQFSIDVTYKEELDPIASLPTPDECEADIAEILTERKINFEPGSSRLDAAGVAIMDDIATILKECGDIRMEIGGHTDSQGREIMNQNLSQERAQTVLNELRKRRVLTSSFTAKGYGESQPIADNDTEEGREANRRIEFRLIRPKPVEEEQTTLESLEEPREEGDDQAQQGQEDTSDEQN